MSIEPIRICCGSRHQGPVCRDGLVMCQICYRRVRQEDLHVIEAGDGTSVETAPIYEDVCNDCAKEGA